MRLKMKNGSHRYDINKARPRNGHKYAKYKMCLSMMMVMCNIRRSDVYFRPYIGYIKVFV